MSEQAAELTIAQVKEKKRELERSVKALLDEFTAATGVVVERLDVDAVRIQAMQEKYPTINYVVEADTRI